MMKCSVFLLLGLLVSFESSVTEAMIICKAQSVSRGEPANITCSFNRDLSQFRGVYYVHRYDKNNQFKEILNCAWTQDRYKCDEDPNYSIEYVDASTLMLRISSASDDDVGSYVCQTTPADMDQSEPCMFELRDSKAIVTTPEPNVPGNDASGKIDSSTKRATTQRSLEGKTTLNANGSQIFSVATETGVQKEDMEKDTEGGVPLVAIVVPVVLVVVTGVAVAVAVVVCRKRRRRKQQNKHTSAHEVERILPDVTGTGKAGEATPCTKCGSEAEPSANLANNKQGNSEMDDQIATENTEAEKKETDQLLPKTAHHSNEPDTTDDGRLVTGEIDVHTEQDARPYAQSARMINESSELSENGLGAEEEVTFTLQQAGLQEQDDSQKPSQVIRQPENKEHEFNKDTVHLQSIKGAGDALAESHLTEEQRLLLDACGKNDVQKVRSLLEKDVDVNYKGEEGETPLHVACRGGGGELCDILLGKQADVEAKDNEGMVPLHWACKHGKLNLVKRLLEKGSSINAHRDDGATALHLACSNGLNELVKVLLENRAEVEAIDGDRMTPLHWACKYGKKAAIETLLESHANINAEDKNGRTPFHIAYQNDHVEVLTILLEKGYNFEMKDERGMTALRWACENDNSTLKKQLLDRGANIFTEGKDGKNSIEVALGKLKYEDEIKDEKGVFRALRWACEAGDDAITKELVLFRADVTSKDKDGNTPLHIACKHGRLAVVNTLLSKQINTLLSKPVNIDEENNKGWTPLHMACKNGSIEIVVRLRGGGANKSICTKDGKKPKHIAKLNGHGELEETLKKWPKKKH